MLCKYILTFLPDFSLNQQFQAGITKVGKTSSGTIDSLLQYIFLFTRQLWDILDRPN